jgi:alpha-beta hydrolase superfamily lysophospholipase
MTVSLPPLATHVRGRKSRRRLLIVGCLVFAVLLATEFYYANRLVAPANRAVGQPPAELNVVATTIASDSGSNLATWYVPADNAHATVILLHAIRADRRAMLSRARLFHQAGYAVVMIDFQAHGESVGDHITMGHLERHDAKAAVDYARSLNPTHRIGIVGWSLGGAAALLASPLQIDAMVLESVYPTIAEAVYNRIAMRLGPLSGVLSPILLWQFQLLCGVSQSDLHPIDHIADIGCPVLVVGGELDEHTTLAESQRMFDAAKEPKKLVTFKGANHTDFLAQNSELYQAEILPFLATYLAK